MFWFLSCAHLPLSSESRETTYTIQKDNLVFEQKELLFTSPLKISDDLPQNLVEHFTNVFGEKVDVWKPRPPRTPTTFIEPQIIRQVHQKKDLKTNNAIPQLILDKPVELQPSLHHSVPQIEIPHVLFQEKTSVWLVHSSINESQSLSKSSHISGAFGFIVEFWS